MSTQDPPTIPADVGTPYWLRFTTDVESRACPFEYWVTGQGLNRWSICALIQARNDVHAIEQLHAAWPDACWDFVDRKTPGWRPASDRFPPQAEDIST